MGVLNADIYIQLVNKPLEPPLTGSGYLQVSLYGRQLGSLQVTSLNTVKDEVVNIQDLSVDILDHSDLILEGTGFSYFQFPSQSSVQIIMGSIITPLSEYFQVLIKRSLVNNERPNYAETGTFRIYQGKNLPIVDFHCTFGVFGIYTGFNLTQYVLTWLTDDIDNALGDVTDLQYVDRIGDAVETRVYLAQRAGQQINSKNGITRKEFLKKMLQDPLLQVVTDRTIKRADNYFDPESHLSIYQTYIEPFFDGRYAKRPAFDEFFPKLMREKYLIDALTAGTNLQVWNPAINEPSEFGKEIMLHPLQVPFRITKYALDTMAMALSYVTGLDLYTGKQTAASVLVNGLQSMTYIQALRYGAYLGSSLTGTTSGLVAGAYLGGMLNIFASGLVSKVGDTVVYKYVTGPLANKTADVIEEWTPTSISQYLKRTQNHRKVLDGSAKVAGSILAQIAMAIILKKLPRSYRWGAAGNQVAVIDRALREGVGYAQGVQVGANQLMNYANDAVQFRQNRDELYDLVNDRIEKTREVYKDLSQTLKKLSAYGIEEQNLELFNQNGRVIKQNFQDFKKYLTDTRYAITNSMIPRLQTNLNYIEKLDIEVGDDQIQNARLSLDKLDHYLKTERSVKPKDAARWISVVKRQLNSSIRQFKDIMKQLKPKGKEPKAEWVYDDKANDYQMYALEAYNPMLPEIEDFVPDSKTRMLIHSLGLGRDTVLGMLKSVGNAKGAGLFGVSSLAALKINDFIKTNTKAIYNPQKLLGNRPPQNNSRTLNTTNQTEIMDAIQAIDALEQLPVANPGKATYKYLDKIGSALKKINVTLPTETTIDKDTISMGQSIGAALLGSIGLYGIYNFASSKAADEKLEAIVQVANNEPLIEKLSNDYDRGIIFNNTLGWESNSRTGRNNYRLIHLGRQIGSAIDRHLEQKKRQGIKRRLIYY